MSSSKDKTPAPAPAVFGEAPVIDTGVPSEYRVVTESGGFRYASSTQRLDAEDADARRTHGATEPIPPPKPPGDGGPTLPKSALTSEGAQCFYNNPQGATFAEVVQCGPLAFTDANLGATYHDINQIDVVYRWTPGAQIPAGVWVLPDNALVNRATRRKVLGRENVG